MMVKHAGLPQWQMSKTVVGMSMWAKQLMYTFALCLRSPPTSVLHCWTVDSHNAKSSYQEALKDPRAVRFAKKTSNQYLGYFNLKVPSAPPNTKRSEVYSISIVSEDKKMADTIADVDTITTDTPNVTVATETTITSDVDGEKLDPERHNSEATVASSVLPLE